MFERESETIENTVSFGYFNFWVMEVHIGMLKPYWFHAIPTQNLPNIQFCPFKIKIRSNSEVYLSDLY